MFNLRKMISYIINIIIAIIVLTIWGEILILFKIDKYIVLIISIPLIITLTFISQNVNKKSIGYKISEKLIKDENKMISIIKIVLLIFIINLIVLFIKVIIK